MQRLSGSWSRRREISTELFKNAAGGAASKIRDVYESTTSPPSHRSIPRIISWGDKYSDAGGFIRMLGKIPFLRLLVIHGDLVHKTHAHLDETDQQTSDAERVCLTSGNVSEPDCESSAWVEIMTLISKDRAATGEVHDGIEHPSGSSRDGWCACAGHPWR